MIFENIKEARKKSGLNKAEVARRLNIPYTTYNNYETGFSEPKLDTLQKIAEVIGCSLGELLSGTSFSFPISLTKSIDFNEYLFSLGYEIVLEKGALENDNASAYLIGPEGVYKTTINDFTDLRQSTESFIKFKVSEVISKSVKVENMDGYPSGPRFLSIVKKKEKDVQD